MGNTLNKSSLFYFGREKMTEVNKAVGYSSIDELIKIDKDNKDVIPIILKHLSKITNEKDKEFLVRCLGVKGFFEATDLLIKEFKSSSNTTYKWAIGNCL
jgi:hypothetical protein